MAAVGVAIGGMRGGLLLAVALVSASARAQQTDDARARADALFREGQDLLTAGQIPTACARLEESQRLDPKLGRLLNLAYCHEKLGRVATAWSEYNQAAALALQTKQAERETFARKQASQLAQKLSFIRVDLAAAPEVSQVTIDGASLTRDQWRVPFPVDPGDHALTFAGAGRKVRTQTVAVSTAGTTRIAVAPLEPEASTPPDQAPAPPAAKAERPAEALPTQPPQADPLEPPPARGSRMPGFVVGGVGVAALGVGVAFGVRAITLKSDADPQCPNHMCTQSGLASIGDAKTAATISTIGLAVGAVGVGLGTWLVLRVPSSPATAGAALVPYIAADGAALAWRGEW
jgi:serine/threonine-protein kinase